MVSTQLNASSCFGYLSSAFSTIFNRNGDEGFLNQQNAYDVTENCRTLMEENHENEIAALLYLHTWQQRDLSITMHENKEMENQILYDRQFKELHEMKAKHIKNRLLFASMIELCAFRLQSKTNKASHHGTPTLYKKANQPTVEEPGVKSGHVECLEDNCLVFFKQHNTKFYRAGIMVKSDNLPVFDIITLETGEVSYNNKPSVVLVNEIPSGTYVNLVTNSTIGLQSALLSSDVLCQSLNTLTRIRFIGSNTDKFAKLGSIFLHEKTIETFKLYGLASVIEM